jgi:hypothetical protein
MVFYSAKAQIKKIKRKVVGKKRSNAFLIVAQSLKLNVPVIINEQ